jgi:hypothetical protein
MNNDRIEGWYWIQINVESEKGKWVMARYDKRSKCFHSPTYLPLEEKLLSYISNRIKTPDELQQIR